MESSSLLRKMRILSGLSVQKLATKSGVSRSAIYKIEKNPNATPSVEVVKILVMATKPNGDHAEWFKLAIRLIFDENTSLSMEKLLFVMEQTEETKPSEFKSEGVTIVDRLKSKFTRLKS